MVRESPDFKLIVGVDVSRSTETFKQGIADVLKEINSKPELVTIKLKIDPESLKSIKADLKEITQLGSQLKRYTGGSGGSSGNNKSSKANDPLRIIKAQTQGYQLLAQMKSKNDKWDDASNQKLLTLEKSIKRFNTQIGNGSMKVDSYNKSVAKLKNTFAELQSTATLLPKAAKEPTPPDKNKLLTGGYGLMKTVNGLDGKWVADDQKQLDDLKKNLGDLNKQYEDGAIDANAYAEGVKNSRLELTKLQSTATKLPKPEKVVPQLTQNADPIGFLAAVKRLGSAKSGAQKSLIEFGAARYGKGAGDYNDIKTAIAEYNKLFIRLQNGELTLQSFNEELAKQQVTVQIAADHIHEFGEDHEALTKTFGDSLKRLASWASAVRVLTSIYRTISKMAQVSIELDAAFAQLQIVTGATDAQMRKFSETTVTLAKNLGQSVTDVAKSIEVFSRLGYNLEEAGTLAQQATILSNVAGTSQDEATKGLTAIVKGYGLKVEDASHVADVLIEVGQKYAVSASELMQAYERSGAALNATNTTFEKSAGLIAAANASVQNANTVGTALKTVSARIRGSKTDLTELGEDTEEFVDGFSKYASELRAITGFNILVEGTTNKYKDLYDIMDGIAGVWSELTDTQQARVAEILGGTRQLQVIASIIGNWGDATKAYASAMDSAGVATKANSRYMETAQAHLNQFKATYQELTMTVANTDMVKQFIDLGTHLLQILNTLAKLQNAIGGVKTLVVAIAGVFLTIRITDIVQKGKDIIGVIRTGITALKTLQVTAESANAAWTVGTGGVMLALTAVMTVVGLVKKAQEDHRKALDNSVESYNAAVSEADQYKSRIQELQDKLHDENTSIEDANEARAELLSIQDALIDKYGSEATAINLVGDSAERSAGKIDKLTAALAAKNIEEFREDYDRSRRAMETSENFYTSEYQGTTNKESRFNAWMYSYLSRIASRHSGFSANVLAPGQYSYDITAKPREAKEIFDDILAGIQDLRRELTVAGIDDGGMLNNFVDNLIDQSKVVDNLLTENENRYDQYIRYLIASTDDYSKLSQKVQQITSDLTGLMGNGGNVDLAHRNRVQITDKNLDIVSGWWGGDSFTPGDYMTVASQTVDDGKGTFLVVTPILPNGELLTQDELDEYIEHIFSAPDGNYLSADTLGIIMGSFGDLKSADEFAVRVHDVHEQLEDLKDEIRSFQYVSGQEGVGDYLIQQLDNITFSTTTASSVLKSATDELQSSGKLNFESLTKFKKAVDALHEAYNDLSKDGKEGGLYSALETIHDQFSDVDGIDRYISRLLDAKDSADDFREILNELITVKVLDETESKLLAGTDEKLIAAMLREAGVANDDQAALEILTVAKERMRMKTFETTEELMGFINGLANEASYSDLARSSLIKLAAQQVATNNTNMTFAQQIQALQTLARSAGVAAGSLAFVQRVAAAVADTSALKRDINGNLTRDSYMEYVNGIAKVANNISPDDMIKSYLDAINSATTNIDFNYRPAEVKKEKQKSTKDTTNSKKEIEEYIVEIERYREAIKRLNETKEAQAKVDEKVEHSSDLKAQIVMQRQLAQIYSQEQKALHNLNNLRDADIEAGAEKLRGLGFDVSYNADTNKLWIANMEHINELTLEDKEAQNELRKETEALIKDITDLNEKNAEASQQWWDLKYATEAADEQIQQLLKDIVAEASTAVDNLQNVYSVLHSAADEYASTGYITVDTLQSVIGLGVEYMAYLTDENGQLVINEERIREVIAAKTEQLAIESSLSYIEALRIAQNKGNEAELNRLLYATESLTGATWGLVYANLEYLNLSKEQKEAALANINAIRAMADSAKANIGNLGNSVLDELNNMKSGLDDILKYVMDMLKQRIQDQVDALNDMKSAYSDIINKQKESIRASKEEANSKKTITNKLKEIAKLQAQIDALSLDTSRESQAKRASLLEELAQKQEDLADTQNDYMIKKQEEALDKMNTDYSEQKDQEIKILQNSISSQQKLYDMSIDYIGNNWNTLYDELISWNTEYGNVLNSEITSAWDACLAAAERYGNYVSALGSIDADITSAQNSLTLGNTNYDSSFSNEEAARVLVNRMKENSALWFNATADDQKHLSDENIRIATEELPQYIGGTPYRKNGVWYLPDGRQLYSVYHKGGIVGSPTLRQNEMMAVLENGEAVLNKSQQGVLNNLLSIIARLTGGFGGSNAFGDGSSVISSLMSKLISPRGGSEGALIRVDQMTVNAPVQVVQKLDRDEIREHANTIGSVAAEYIKEGFTKHGVRPAVSII